MTPFTEGRGTFERENRFRLGHKTLEQIIFSPLLASAFSPIKGRGCLLDHRNLFVVMMVIFPHSSIFPCLLNPPIHSEFREK